MNVESIGRGTPAGRPTPAWRSPWVIGWVVLLGTVLAVNAVMITLAFVTSPGLLFSNAYERGQSLEQTITSRAREAPAWTMRIDTPPDLVAGQEGTVRFFVVDRVGQPVRATQVTWQAFRPSDAALDFTMPMVEEAPGRYAARVRFPAPGVWDTLVTVQAGEQQSAAETRIQVQRP